jgi:hypothetical protein
MFVEVILAKVVIFLSKNKSTKKVGVFASSRSSKHFLLGLAGYF